MKVLGVKYGIEITRPWNSQMYDHNDEVAREMHKNLFEVMEKAEAAKDEKTVRLIAKSLNGWGYGEGFSLEQMIEETYQRLSECENYILNQEYGYLVRQEIGLPALEKEMVGYN